MISDSANCTVLRAVVLTQYRRVTDGRIDRQTDRQTDGIAVAITALAMRALLRAVKVERPIWKSAFALNMIQFCAGSAVYRLLARVHEDRLSCTFSRKVLHVW